MLQDFKRSLGEVFSWIGTVLPIGRKTAVKIFLLAVILLGFYFYQGFFIEVFLAAVYFLLAFFILFFFRDPLRKAEFAQDEIACPADGKILSIKTEDNPDIIVIRIFLTVFNVHIQRAPISGFVEEVKYTKGHFFFANNPQADKNERNLITIKDGDKTVAFEQITGAIARRIECWVTKDDPLKAGQKAGLIYFGSQVALYLPKDRVRITVKEGQSVQGALTVIGLWK